MQRVIASVLATIGLLASITTATAQSVQPKTAGTPAGTNNQPILESPPTPSVGDTFTYRVGLVRAPEVWSYLGQNGDQLCYSIKQENLPTRTRCIERTGKFQSASATTDFGMVPGRGGPNFVRLRLSFPLFVGKTWEYQWVNDPREESQFHAVFSHYTTKVQVTGYEPVAVGAGTFEAYKIDATTIQWGESGNPFLTTMYYSPQLGVIKRHAFATSREMYPYDFNSELIGYTHAQANAAR